MRGSWLAAAVLAALMLGGCGSGGGGETAPPPGAGEILTGPTTPAGSALISPAGGSFSVTPPGGTTGGITVTVPAGAYAQPRTFTVATAPIFGSTFGALFHAVSPLVLIGNGGGYASRLMTVRIPVTLPAGHFAMGFAYDPGSGTLEGLPVVRVDDTAVTLAVRHFAGVRAQAAETRLVVSSVATSELAAAATTGFRPGRDDIATPNYGSVRFTAGHGAGQAAAALWYYLAQRATGAPALSPRFPGELATLWEDDLPVIPWASAAQEALHWGTLWADVDSIFATTPDAASWNAFAYSLLLTGQPQCAGLGSALGDAVAVTVWASNGTTLSVADPGFPGDLTRTLAWQSGAFSPYQTVSKTGATVRPFATLRYLGQSAVLPWTDLAALWPSVQNGTVSHAFPEVDQRRILENGTNIRLDTSAIYHVPQIAIGAQVEGRNDYVTIYTAAGELVGSGTAVPVPLTIGDNRLGICTHRGNSPREGWEGFRWVTLKRAD